MKLVLPSGTSSYTTYIFVKDSSSTTGAGLTGLAYNTASLTCYYIRKGQSSTTSVSLATATLGTWTSGGFVVVDGTNMPGVYELGIPNACFSGGTCILYLKGAANMVPVKIEIQIEPVPSNVTQYGGTGAQFINAYPIVNAFDRQLVASSTNNTLTVSATMSNGANYVGHLMTITNATGLYDTVMCTGFSAPSTFTANRNWRTNPDNTSIVTFFFSNGARVDANGNVLSDVQSILGTVYTGTAGYFIDWSKIQNGTATVGLSGTTISTSQVITSVSGAVGSVTGAVGSVTGNVDGNVTGTVASVVGNVGGNVAGSVASVTAGVTVTTNNDKTGYSLTVTPPTTTDIASVLFVDGITNKLKVNTDHSVNATVSSGGSGANSVTIVVEDENGDPLQNATVTAKLNGSISDTGLTDVDGEYILHLDDGTYSLAITCPGYTGAGNPALVVNGDETPAAYTLTAMTITPSDPPFVTGYLVTRVAGVATEGVVVTIAMTRTATGETGSAYLGSDISVTSDSNGLATFNNLSAGATYRIRMEVSGIEWTSSFVADDTTFEIKSFVG